MTNQKAAQTHAANARRREIQQAADKAAKKAVADERKKNGKR
jgi:hypothetical protein